MVCALCGKNDLKELFTPEEFVLLKCGNCSLVQVADPLKEFNLDNYGYYRGRLNYPKERLYNRITAKRYAGLLNRLKKYRHNSFLLDIGCGEGHFLQVAQAMRWDARGVEAAPFAVEVCRKFGVKNVDCVDPMHTQLPAGCYDIITMFEVLEHVACPRGLLSRIRDSLRKKGALVITTPNFSSITSRLCGKNWSLVHKEHLFYYTPDSLKKMLLKEGFQVVSIKTKGITLPEISAYLFGRSTERAHHKNLEIRETIEGNRLLKLAKGVVNNLLNILRLGETIECISEKK